jgi:hypothetical protein
VPEQTHFDPSHCTCVYESRNCPHFENPKKMCPASIADMGTASLRQKASRAGSRVNNLVNGARVVRVGKRRQRTSPKL